MQLQVEMKEITVKQKDMVIGGRIPITVELLNRSIKAPTHLQSTGVANVHHVNLVIMREAVAVPVILDALKMATVRNRRQKHRF